MDGALKRRFANWHSATAFGLVYIVLGFAALQLAERSGGIAFVWPASGVAVAGLLLLKAPFRLAHLGIVALGGFALNIAFGNSELIAAGFAFANVVECVIVGRISCLGDERCGRFDDPRWSVRFLAGSIIGGLASASIATGVIAFIGAAGLQEFFLSWLSTVILGMLIVTPAIVEGARAIHEGRAFVMPSAVKMLSLAGVLLSAVFAFAISGYPLLFVPLVAVVIATFALRTTGAIAGILIVAAVGTLATAYGYGPVVMISSEMPEQVAFLQFYLLMILVCVLPIGSMLSDAHRDALSLTRSNRLLAKAESLAHMGHWRFEVGSEDVYWSAEVYRIYGLKPGNGRVPLRVATGAYHPDDQEIVNSAVERSALRGEEFQFEARILRADGSIRHVYSQGEVEFEGGKPKAVFGVFLDISERQAVLEELSLAHQEAERNAREAQRLAETDQLTGVANRRRLMNDLQTAIETAQADPDFKLSFLMIDVDDFKIINDTCGHPVGDAVLTRIAQIATSCLRDQDVVGRMGGEEFGIVLRGADKRVGSKIAERIRQSVEKETFEGLDRVSISIGLAEFMPDADMTWLIQQADTALYVAKRSGKNQLQFAA